MRVDISPKRPPISSWTAEAPSGSGSDGGGSSTWSRSKRWIMRHLASDGGTGSGRPTRSAAPDSALRPNRDRSTGLHAVADANAPGRQHLAPDPEGDVVLAAELRGDGCGERASDEPAGNLAARVVGGRRACAELRLLRHLAAVGEAERQGRAVPARLHLQHLRGPCRELEARLGVDDAERPVAARAGGIDLELVRVDQPHALDGRDR